jgi:hypothetical protein
MTFLSTAQSFEGSTPVATTTRMIRILAVAAGILAFSATAAQARPIGLVGGAATNAPVASGTQGYHTFYRPSARTSYMTGSVDSPTQQGTRMSPSVDPANDQSVPVISTAPVVVKTADKSFDWTASLIGAAIAAAVLLLAAITASRLRPRRVAQL